jgi:hypothetical protein
MELWAKAYLGGGWVNVVTPLAPHTSLEASFTEPHAPGPPAPDGKSSALEVSKASGDDVHGHCHGRPPLPKDVIEKSLTA